MATHSWYGLRTKSRFEKAAAASLAYKGYQYYLPTYRSRRRWSDRMTEVQAPLFPGYVFCRFDVSQRLPILVIPGIVSVVGIGREPASIPDEEIAAIETVLRSGLNAEPWPYLPEGQRVRVDKRGLICPRASGSASTKARLTGLRELWSRARKAHGAWLSR